MMMARGLLVVDENLMQIVPALKELGIRVIVPRSGESDDFIATEILPSRTFVTRNVKDFLSYALGQSIGLISLEGLKFIDGETKASKNKTVQIISKAIIEYELWSKSDGFILELRDDGNHKFKEF
jgi:hypothetical protein